jgi:hypothetical protein
MLGDLLVITPTRGRPQSLARLLDAVHATGLLDTHVFAAVDNDDPCIGEYEQVLREHGGPADHMDAGMRDSLTGWTNVIAKNWAPAYPFLASLGDDMVPRTRGWDKALVRAIQDMGGTGFAYPWDGIRTDIPEAVVMSSDIVRALGWMCNPDLQHFWIDDTWADLGHGADCIRFLRAIVVEHIHPATGKIPKDRTNDEANEKIPADREAYFRWRATRMAEDVEKIRLLREKAEPSVR